MVLTGKERRERETVHFVNLVYLVLPSGNIEERKPHQEDRCELPLSSGQGQVLFSERCSRYALEWIRTT